MTLVNNDASSGTDDGYGGQISWRQSGRECYTATPCSPRRFMSSFGEMELRWRRAADKRRTTHSIKRRIRQSATSTTVTLAPSLHAARRHHPLPSSLPRPYRDTSQHAFHRRTRNTLYFICLARVCFIVLSTMGTDQWVDRGPFPSYFLKWRGRPVFCPTPYFSRYTFFLYEWTRCSLDDFFQQFPLN